VAAAAAAHPPRASTEATAYCGCRPLSSCLTSARASPRTQKSRMACPKLPLRPLRASTHAANPALSQAVRVWKQLRQREKHHSYCTAHQPASCIWLPCLTVAHPVLLPPRDVVTASLQKERVKYRIRHEAEAEGWGWVTNLRGRHMPMLQLHHSAATRMRFRPPAAHRSN
jgi:hypothetical protein